jgi:hypothetical protein
MSHQIGQREREREIVTFAVLSAKKLKQLIYDFSFCFKADLRKVHKLK